MTTPVPPKAFRGEFTGIQYLRAVAAIMVVLFHLEPQLRRMGYTGPWLPGLSSGVDVFFVISGFIMWVTTCDRTITPQAFWLRRITRIVPLYWLFTSVVVAMMLAAPQFVQTIRFDLHHVIASYLFIPAAMPATGRMEPVVIPGWTLNYEMFFYLVFGLFLLAPPKWRWIGTCGSLFLLVVAGWVTHPPATSIAGFYSSDIILEFVLGMALGAIAARGDILARIPALVGVIVAGVGLLLLALEPQFAISRFLSRGLFACLIVAGMLVWEAHGRLARLSLLHLLGDASYSIYLSHFLALSAVGQLARRLGTSLPLPLREGGFCLFGLAASIAVGVLSYRYLELPIIALIRMRRRAVTT